MERVTTALPQSVALASLGNPSVSTPPGSRRLLLETHSPTTAFNTWLTEPRTEALPPEAAVVPALVQGLHHLGHVVRECYLPVRCGMCCLPACHSFRRATPVDFPLRKQKLGVPMCDLSIAHRSGFSRFGTVSADDSLASPPTPKFGWAFHR